MFPLAQIEISTLGMLLIVTALGSALLATAYARVASDSLQSNKLKATIAALRRAEAKYRGIFENSVEGIFQTTAAGQYLSANPALARMYGYASAEELIFAIRDIDGSLYVNPRRRQDFTLLMQQSDVISRFESEIYRKDGSTIWISENARVVRDSAGEIEYYEGTVVDISEQKLTESLRLDKEAADAANRAKSQFLANMSHEVRTPLNGALGMLELLADTALTAQQQRYLNIARTSSDQLLNVLNQILDFSKIEAGMLELECIDFDLRALMEESLDIFSARAAEKLLELTLHMPPELPSAVRGDPHRLRQVILNLLGNAIKFTQRGQVVVRVTQEKEIAGQLQLRVAVEDTGVGIAPQQHDRLFRSFSQADASATRKHGGTGLGLAICKQLIELMRGQIGVQSQLNDGSTFWFRLPLAKSTIAAQTPEIPCSLPGLRVLVVDDNATNRELLFRYLSNWQCHAQMAPDGLTALQMLQASAPHRPFDLAIVDGQMPVMDGFDLVRQIAADAALSHTAIVMLTSMACKSDATELASLGVQAYLNKPVRQALLRDTLSQVAHESRQSQRPCAAGVAAATSSRSALTQPAQTETVSGRRAKLLLVEDNEINRLVALEVLERAGYPCDTAENGRDGVDRLLDFAYDAVLMDCQMPVMDGFAAAAEIRRLEREGGLAARGYRVPIVALTANAIDGDRDACLAAGMDGYLTKPLNAVKLIELLDVVLENLDRQPGAIDPRPRTAHPPRATFPKAAASRREDAFDWHSLEQRCGHNMPFVAKMLSTLAARLPDERRAIANALAAADYDTAARLLHTLKGAAASLSATGLLAAAGELESCCRRTDAANIISGWEQLQTEIDRCLAAISLRDAAANRIAESATT